jgi:predicted nucleotidyltransferase
MTQKEAALFLGVSDKTYFRYESEEKYINTLKYQKMCDLLSEKCRIDEEHGILTINEIKEVVSQVFKNYDINYCYLFGSYAKGKANEKSDVDLLIDSNVTGLKYYGLLQELIDSLHKKVDLIKVEQAKDNLAFINEILKDGVKIYG